MSWGDDVADKDYRRDLGVSNADTERAPERPRASKVGIAHVEPQAPVRLVSAERPEALETLTQAMKENE